MNGKSPQQPDRSMERSILLWLFRAFMVWIFIYIFFQGQNGFFAVTVERVESAWIRFVILNIPLQLALAIVASWGLTDKASVAAVRFGLVIAIINTVLILAHITVSVATA